MKVTNIRFVSAPADASPGLLGWASFVLDDSLRLDSIAVRRTRAGELALSFPARLDRRGAEHPYIRPIDHAARIAIEAQVFAALPARITEMLS